jgi:hypothetical protein
VASEQHAVGGGVHAQRLARLETANVEEFGIAGESVANRSGDLCHGMDRHGQNHYSCSGAGAGGSVAGTAYLHASGGGLFAIGRRCAPATDLYFLGDQRSSERSADTAEPDYGNWSGRHQRVRAGRRI